MTNPPYTRFDNSSVSVPPSRGTVGPADDSMRANDRSARKATVHYLRPSGPSLSFRLEINVVKNGYVDYIGPAFFRSHL